MKICYILHVLFSYKSRTGLAMLSNLAGEKCVFLFLSLYLMDIYSIFGSYINDWCVHHVTVIIHILVMAIFFLLLFFSKLSIAKKRSLAMICFTLKKVRIYKMCIILYPVR